MAFEWMCQLIVIYNEGERDEGDYEEMARSLMECALLILGRRRVLLHITVFDEEGGLSPTIADVSRHTGVPYSVFFCLFVCLFVFWKGKSSG